MFPIMTLLLDVSDIAWSIKGVGDRVFVICHVPSYNERMISVCEGLRSRCELPECEELTTAESGRSLCFTTIL